MNKTVLELIYQSVDEINNDDDQEKKLEKSPDTILLGAGSFLDSLGLVNFIVSVEQNINDSFDSTITLADERAMSQKQSPFSTVATLADYIEMRIKESKSD